MSLYIGKLSPRISRDELEHVFKRFGRCIVKMKGGYGFVVYDSIPNAQKALRAVQGRNICGERLQITWSNIQPRDGKKIAIGARYNESERGRNYGKGRNDSNGKFDSDGHRGGLHLRHCDTDAGRLDLANMLDEVTSHPQDDSKDTTREHHEKGENLGKVDEFLVDSQQNEQVNEISKTHGIHSGIEFERYDPSKAADGKGDDEYYLTSSGSSHRLRYSEKSGMEKIDETDLRHCVAPKSKLTCYKCGGLGHKMRECPEGSALRKKSSWIDRSDDEVYGRDRGKRKLDEYGSEAQEKQLSSRDSRSRVRNTEKIPQRVKRSSIIIENSRSIKEIHSSQKWEYEGRKRGERNGDLRKHDSKRARRSSSSHDHSNNSASIIHSASRSLNSVPLSNPHSRSRSVADRAISLSPNSRATSLSPHSKYRVSKSKSRSSTPLSLSLSLSPSLQNPSSPSKRHFSSKGSMGNSIPLEPKDTLVEQGQAMEGNNYSLVEQGQRAEAIKILGDTDLQNLDASPYNEHTVSLPRDDSYLEEHQPVLADNAKLDNALSLFSTEDELRSDIHLEKNGQDNVITAAESHYGTGTGTSTLLLEQSNLSDGKSSLEGLRGTMGQQNSGSPIEYMLASAEKQKISTQVPDSSCSYRCTSISSEEMCMVLEHYGLDLPNEDEKNLPVDVYFGSARLWPWNLIYYRRLKKGLISIENYASRVAQNREYGIVDRYIRSSSGWAESSGEKS